jgi:hypothetical protein
MGGHEVFVASGADVDVNVRRSAKISGGNRPLEPKRASPSCDHACVAAPVVTTVRALLPEFNDRATDRGAIRIAENAAGQDMPSSDARPPRCRRGVCFEWPAALRESRATSGHPRRRRAGAYDACGSYDYSGDKKPACHAHTARSVAPRRG